MGVSNFPAALARRESEQFDVSNRRMPSCERTVSPYKGQLYAVGVQEISENLPYSDT